MTKTNKSSSASIEQETKLAFETWVNNNKISISSIKFDKDAIEFEKSHYISGTYATLHAFKNAEEGMKCYNKFLKLL